MSRYHTIEAEGQGGVKRRGQAGQMPLNTQLSLSTTVTKSRSRSQISHQSVGTSILEILKLSSAVPPTGTRSLPVAKCSSFFCSSSGKVSTTSQKHLVEKGGVGG